jgi:hypothetical protein
MHRGHRVAAWAWERRIMSVPWGQEEASCRGEEPQE